MCSAQNLNGLSIIFYRSHSAHMRRSDVYKTRMACPSYFIVRTLRTHDAPTYTSTTDKCGARSGSPNNMFLAPYVTSFVKTHHLCSKIISTFLAIITCYDIKNSHAKFHSNLKLSCQVIREYVHNTLILVLLASVCVLK